MNKINIYLIALLLFFGTTTGILTAMLLDARAEANRNLQNYNAVEAARKQERNGYAITQHLTRQQFEEKYSSLLDSLNRERKDKIKLSRMLGISQIHIQKLKDSIRVDWHDSITPGKNIVAGRALRFDDACARFSVFYPTDSSYALISSEIDIRANVLLFRGERIKRARIFGINLWRYGPRQPSAQVITNCGDSTFISVESVEVVK